MTTTQDLTAEIFSAVKNMSSVSALTMISEPRFRGLRSIVQDNIDSANVKYPIGFGDSFMSLTKFYEHYNNQTNRKETYTVKVPVSKIFYKQGGVRLVLPEYCSENFELYNHTVDFCESEIPVFFYDEVTGEFNPVKKQHTTAQIAAIAQVTGQDLEVMARVVAFESSVSQTDRSLEASKVFYKEIKGINATKDWEALPHQVACGDVDAINTMNFYKSIPGLTWQPISFPFPLVTNPHFTCTKVAQMKKLVSYATNDDALDTLKDIVQTLCNSVDWEKEKPEMEISSYLLRGLYNFEKRLHSLLDDAMGGLGINFNMTAHIEDFFSTFTVKRYLGSTSTDKKPWQHLVKSANNVNNYLIKSGQITDSFFNVKNQKFVDEIYALANPTSKSSVSADDVKNYIRCYCQ
jgi:hypothetical protein